jgi:outer membrane protein
MARSSRSLTLNSLIAGPILAGLALLAPLGAHAEMKIAVVNVPRLLDEAPQAKSAMQALQDEFAPRQKEIMAQQKELKAKEDKLNRDGAVMAENERRNAEKDLRDGQRELARKQNEYVEDLNLRRNEEIGKLQRSLLQEVQAFARTASYDLIVGEGVLYVNESMDITAQVLTALQARYKATGGVAPKPATPKPAAAAPPPPQSKPQQ